MPDYIRASDTPPSDPSELTFLATDTRTPFVDDYPGHRRQQNRTVHAPLGKHPRRGGAVERDGECDDRSVKEATAGSRKP